MSAFESVRQAIAYHFSCRRGPAMSRPRWHDAPPTTGRTPWDHVEVGALLYGPESAGMCAVSPGDDLDDELQEWAEGYEVELSDRAADVVAQMGRLLLEHGLKPQVHVPEPAAFVRWTYPDGTSGLRMRAAGANATRSDSG